MNHHDDTPPAVCRRHDWIPVDETDPDAGYACTQCPASTPACTLCRHPLATRGRTCEDCVSWARNTARDVRDLYRRLPDVIAAVGGLHAIRYDRGAGAKPGKGGVGADTTILGGAAMVMASVGHVGHRHPLDDTATPAQLTIDIALRQAENADPPSVLAVLTGWEDSWRHEQHHHAAERTTVAAAVDYLVLHTSWAAQHSAAWAEYVEDLRDLHHRLRILTGDDRRPVKAGVPCPFCAGTIVQTWTDDGLGDVRRCDLCGITWASEAHFMLAIRQAHQALPQTHPDQLVTLEDAKRIYKGRVRPNVIDVWVARGNVRPVLDERGVPRRDVRGSLLYRLGHIDLQANGREEAS